jgi:predicted deacylase
MVRYFNGKALKTLGEGKMTTLKALVLVSSTLADGQIVYDKPTSFTFEYDKTLDKADVEIKARNGDTLQTVESTTKTEDKKIIVTPKAELARNTQFVLTIKEAEAEDGSAIPIELIVNFSMSGGPKVTGISAAKTGVALGGSIIVYFDQEIANVDAIASLAVVNGLNAQVVKSGNNLVINYTAGTCTDFSITVKKGLESAAGVTQQDEWGYAGRTICYTVRSIGASRQGRAITATTFGAGAKTILFTGAIHGNEISSRNLMNLWINELDANARSIPAGVRVVVIPTINPDGVAANSRYNAAGVDLNRNFDTSDWKKDVETVNGTPLPNGGGATRASEPETQAMVNITRELRPVLTMSYHSSASYAIANTCGNSGGLASAYAQITGYRNMTGVSGAFAYQITGTYDDWICERLGLASVLIELASSTNAEFSRNRAAMWAMVRS